MAIVANDRGFSALAEVFSEKGLDGLGSAVELLSQLSTHPRITRKKALSSNVP